LSVIIIFRGHCYAIHYYRYWYWVLVSPEANIIGYWCLSWYRSNPIPIIKYYKNRCCYKATRTEQQCVLYSCSGVTWSHHLCRRHRYSYGRCGSFLSLVSQG